MPAMDFNHVTITFYIELVPSDHLYDVFFSSFLVPSVQAPAVWSDTSSLGRSRLFFSPVFFFTPPLSIQSSPRFIFSPLAELQSGPCRSLLEDLGTGRSSGGL